jgi:hypothetical protein
MWAASLDLVPRQTHENNGTSLLGNKGLQTEALFTSSRNFVTCQQFGSFRSNTISNKLHSEQEITPKTDILNLII